MAKGPGEFGKWVLIVLAFLFLGPTLLSSLSDLTDDESDLSRYEPILVVIAGVVFLRALED